MTYRTDVAWGRDVVARWYGLAERRLAHLTELFETGRWRRYYSENAFLENIREAKAMLETWRDLKVGKVPVERSNRDALPARTGQTSTSAKILRDQFPAPQLSPPHEPEPAPEIAPLSAVSVAPEADQLSLAQEPIAENSREITSEGTAAELEPASLDIAAIQERYPLLRNSL